MPRGEHTDYSKGYVYMLKNTTTGLIYIGSSCDTLNRRLSKHKCQARSQSCSSYHLFEDEGTVTIEVLDYCPCDTEEELVKQEGYYIRLFKQGCGDICVNEMIPGRSQAQRYKDNRNAMREQRKDYYVRTRETAIQRASTRYEQHKDEIKAYKKVWYTKRPILVCPCGGRYKQHGAHLKTKLHQAYLKTLTPN